MTLTRIDLQMIEKTLSEYANSFETAIAAIGNTPTILTINSQPDDLTADVSIPSNIHLDWRSGATISGTHTLTISGSLSAGDYQLFDESTTISGLKFAYPEWFGPVGSALNDEVYINKAIDSLTSLGGSNNGGTVKLGVKVYKTSAPVLLKHGVEIEGANYHSPGTRLSATMIEANHNDVAVVSFKGAQGCRLERVGITVAATFSPKTHLLFGRDSTGSAGVHEIKRVFTAGVAEVASVYMIASEQNSFIDCIFDLYAGGSGLITLFNCQSDFYNVDSLVSSSNVLNRYLNVDFKNRVDDPAARGIYIRTGSSTGVLTFSGCYGHQARGAYVEINNGQVDGLPSMGGIAFYNQCGEILDLGTGTNSPSYGYYITGNGVAMRGLIISGGVMKQLGSASPSPPNTINSTTQDFEDTIINLTQNKTGTASTGALIASTYTVGDRSIVNHIDSISTMPTELHNNILIGKDDISGTVNGIGILNDNRILATREDGPPLDLNRNGTDGDIVYFRNDGTLVGSISVSGITTAYNTTSDPRLKDIVDMMSDDGINFNFEKLRSCLINYTWKGETGNKSILGLNAHKCVDLDIGVGTEGQGPRELNIGECYQDAVIDDDGNLVSGPKYVTPATVDYSKTTPILIAKIEQLERRLSDIEQ